MFIQIYLHTHIICNYMKKHCSKISFGENALVIKDLSSPCKFCRGENEINNGA